MLALIRHKQEKSQRFARFKILTFEITGGGYNHGNVYLYKWKVVVYNMLDFTKNMPIT